MASLAVDSTRLQSEQEALTMCPICFGYTQLYEGKIYCPSCRLFISDNPNEALKAKVQFIKDEVVTAPRVAKQQHVSFFMHLINMLLSVVVLIALIVGGMTFYEIVQGLAAESQGQYETALRSYEKSTYLFTVPGVKEAIVKAERLSESAQNFRAGQQFYSTKKWQEAIIHYSLVDPEDINYIEAQNKKRDAEYKLMQPN